MPLYNVMERGLKLPRIGTIRKGVQVPVMNEDGKPKKNKNGQIVTRPKELPWFVFKCAESTNGDGGNEVEQAIYAAYGSKEIKELNVFLAYPDAFTNFSFWLEAYTFNQLVARSDERTLTYLFDTVSNETLVKDGVLLKHSSKPDSPAGKIVTPYKVGDTIPHQPDMILGESKESGRAITFKAVGRLTVVIRELRRLATFTLITGGYWYDIPQIYSTIKMVDQITQATGRGANTIPLTLRRIPREHPYTAEDGSKKKKVGYDVELEVRGDIIAGLLQSFDASPFALAIQNNQPVLPANIGNEVDVTEEYVEAQENDEPAETVVAEPADPNDEVISPFNQKAVEYAAKKWHGAVNDDTKAEAARELGRLKREGRITDPMGKKAFKKIVDGGA